MVKIFRHFLFCIIEYKQSLVDLFLLYLIFFSTIGDVKTERGLYSFIYYHSVSPHYVCPDILILQFPWQAPKTELRFTWHSTKAILLFRKLGQT